MGGYPDSSLTGRTALVTGSVRGLGLEMARGLGRAGARVVLNGRDAGTLDAAAARLRGEGLTVTAAAPPPASHGGGGGLDVLTLLSLAGIGVARILRLRPRVLI